MYGDNGLVFATVIVVGPFWQGFMIYDSLKRESVGGCLQDEVMWNRCSVILVFGRAI